MTEPKATDELRPRTEAEHRAMGGFRLTYRRGSYRVSIPNLDVGDGLEVVPKRDLEGEQAASTRKIANNTREWEREKSRAESAERERDEQIEVVNALGEKLDAARSERDEWIAKEQEHARQEYVGRAEFAEAQLERLREALGKICGECTGGSHLEADIITIARAALTTSDKRSDDG